MRVQNIIDMIGNTPLLKIEYYAKIEGSNLFVAVSTCGILAGTSQK